MFLPGRASPIIRHLVRCLLWAIQSCGLLATELVTALPCVVASFNIQPWSHRRAEYHALKRFNPKALRSGPIRCKPQCREESTIGTHTHTHKLTRSHARVLKPTLSNSHVDTHTRTQTLSHTHKHAHTHTHIHTYIHTYTHTHTYTYSKLEGTP